MSPPAELHSWNFFILASAAPSLAGCIAYSFLPESPKFLMTVGRNAEALAVLRRIYARNTGLPADTYPVKTLLVEGGGKRAAGGEGGEEGGGALAEGWRRVAPLFLPPHAARLALVCCIQFGLVMG